jgi:putative Mn2+ efflux pump MntP
MQTFEIAAAAVGLGVDAFSVCLGIGTRWHGPGQKFRLSWHMGLFQFLMPVIGYYASRSVAGVFEAASQWIAFAVLAGIGGKMLWEAVRSHPGAVAEAETHTRPKDPTRGWSLMALSIATSLDALAVGFAVGIEGKHIFPGSLYIGVVAAGMALAGVMLGKRASKTFGKRAEVFGALLLIALGVYFLVR